MWRIMAFFVRGTLAAGLGPVRCCVVSAAALFAIVENHRNVAQNSAYVVARHDGCIRRRLSIGEYHHRGGGVKRY